MKTSRALFIVLITYLMLFQTSCSNDIDPIPGVEFLDQNLQGSIDGIPFVLGLGSAEDPPLNVNSFFISLYDENEDIQSGCFIDDVSHASAFFFIPKEVGIYELERDLSGFGDGRIVYLYNPETNNTIVASNGAIEILEITSNEVFGKIDAKSNGSDAINGNFSVPICPN